jgi:hypothetical protein
MDASSSSIWTAMPPFLGSCRDMCSASSLAGVIGYPAKKRQPAVMAASAHASFPCQKRVCVWFDFFSWVCPLVVGFLL